MTEGVELVLNMATAFKIPISKLSKQKQQKLNMEIVENKIIDCCEAGSQEARGNKIFVEICRI